MSQDIYKKEKYVPCILTRLTDNNAGEKKDDLPQFVPLDTIRNEIIQNLDAILNSKSRPERSDLNNDDELVFSVLGFGLPDFCGRSNSPYEVEKIRREIEEQIIHFEPRIKKDSLVVRLVNIENTRQNFAFTLEIEGEFALDVLLGSFKCASYIDLETGFATVKSID